MTAVRHLTNACTEINLFGPSGVAHDALALSVAAQNLLESALARHGIAAGLATDRREVAAARFSEWEQACAQALGLFIRSARAVFLGESP
ncbi:hypothetical protein [Streptomyces iranensis]